MPNGLITAYEWAIEVAIPEIAKAGKEVANLTIKAKDGLFMIIPKLIEQPIMALGISIWCAGLAINIFKRINNSR